MNRIRIAMPLLVLLASASLPAIAADAALQSDGQAVDQACASDAATAQCGTAKVGSGLLKCIGDYHKANPSFKPAPACMSAIQKLRADNPNPPGVQKPAN